MKLINTYSQFILNETLKTHDIDLTIRIVNSELSLLNYNFNIKKNQNNTVSIILLNFRYLDSVELYLNNLKSLMIDRHGWFPSEMIITNTSGMLNQYSYDDDFIIDSKKYIDNVEIIFEAKFDIEEVVPEKLYHLSIKEYKDDDKIINGEYRYVHKLLISKVFDFDKDNFIGSVSNWWEENKFKYGK